MVQIFPRWMEIDSKKYISNAFAKVICLQIGSLIKFWKMWRKYILMIKEKIMVNIFKWYIEKLLVYQRLKWCYLPKMRWRFWCWCHINRWIKFNLRTYCQKKISIISQQWTMFIQGLKWVLSCYNSCENAIIVNHLWLSPVR